MLVKWIIVFGLDVVGMIGLGGVIGWLMVSDWCVFMEMVFMYNGFFVFDKVSKSWVVLVIGVKSNNCF